MDLLDSGDIGQVGEKIVVGRGREDEKIERKVAKTRGDAIFRI
jgi:hypothetical protein